MENDKENKSLVFNYSEKGDGPRHALLSFNQEFKGEGATKIYALKNLHDMVVGAVNHLYREISKEYQRLDEENANSDMQKEYNLLVSLDQLDISVFFLSVLRDKWVLSFEDDTKKLYKSEKHEGEKTLVEIYKLYNQD